MRDNRCPQCLMPFFDGRCLKCGRVRPLLPGWRWHDTAMAVALVIGFAILSLYVLVD